MKIRSHRESGLALAYAVVAAFVAAALSATLLDFTQASSQLSKTKKNLSRAHYAAEGAIEAAKKQVQTAVANWQVPLPFLDEVQTVTIDGINVNYVVTSTGFSETLFDDSGIQTIVDQYEISATATNQSMRATANRIINSEATPIFQFAVFYTNDLEILPGPNMTLSGRVHSNKDIYMGSNGTLTVNTNYLHSVGNIYRERKNSPGVSTGNVDIRKWVNDPFDIMEPVEYFRMNSISQMDALGAPNASGFDSNYVDGFDINGDGDQLDDYEMPWAPGALEYWKEPDAYAGGTGNTVKTSDHGIGEAVTPQIGSIEMFEDTGGTSGDYTYNAVSQEYDYTPGTGTHDKGFYHESAGLVLQMKADESGFYAWDQDGNDVAPQLQSSGAVRIAQMYDARQVNNNDTTPVLEVDISILNTLDEFPSNGLLYASRFNQGQGNDVGGIRLTEGSELANKLTVVSEGSIYIQGDYNTVNKKGASVIGDAVNLLSNAWDDSKSQGTLPNASDTTYNVALITGNQDTVPGVSYNGGLENLPRFHERWSGVTATIRGSFVNTWTSQHATGAWSYGGDRYTAPTRDWYYDTAFNNVANLPPFTPMAVSARDVVTW